MCWFGVMTDAPKVVLRKVILAACKLLAYDFGQRSLDNNKSTFSNYNSNFYCFQTVNFRYKVQLSNSFKNRIKQYLMTRVKSLSIEVPGFKMSTFMISRSEVKHFYVTVSTDHVFITACSCLFVPWQLNSGKVLRFDFVVTGQKSQDEFDFPAHTNSRMKLQLNEFTHSVTSNFLSDYL